MKKNIMKAKHNEEIQHLHSQYQEKITQLEHNLLDAKASVNLEVKRLEERIGHALCNQPYEDIPAGNRRMMDTCTRIAEQERTAGMLKVHLSELELQLQASLASTYNGSFLWRIPDVRRRKRDAIDGKITSIYSPPFYTGRNGYKMCIRAYLNGDGIGYNTHVSIFFVLMKGKFYFK